MHCRCGDHFIPIHISVALYCRHFQKACVILFHEMVIDFRQRSFTDCWKDIVIDQSNISIISRDSPFIMSIDSDILPHKFFHPGTFRDNKGSKRLFIFNFFFSLLCFFLRCVALWFLVLNAIRIFHTVYYTVRILAFSDISHLPNSGWRLGKCELVTSIHPRWQNQYFQSCFADKWVTLSPWGFNHSVPTNSYLWLPFSLNMR